MNESIQNATAQFETLLREQIARTERMAELSKPVDYAALDKLIIGVCDGDGIGPIICTEAVRVLETLLAGRIAAGKVEIRRIKGLTLENRMAKGQSVPDDVLAAIKACHVLLKGPTTTPKGGTGAKELESANVALRRELDLFANVRPVSVPEEGIDWTFYRENTEGEYVLGSRGVEIPGVLACDFKVTTDLGTERIARAAYEFAKNNGKKHVAIVTKANIMKKTDGKFARICRELAEREYPELELEDWSTSWRQTSSTPPSAQSLRFLCCPTSTATSSPTKQRRFRAASARQAAPMSAADMPCLRLYTVRRPA